MKARTIFWRFFGTYVVMFMATLVVIAGVIWYSETIFHRRLWNRTLSIQADIIAAALPKTDGHLDIPRIESLLAGLSQSDEANRVTIILPDGRIVGDSQAALHSMDMNEDRREIREALENGTGFAERYSRTFKFSTIYFARCVLSPEGDIQAIVRIAVPTRVVRKEKADVERWLFGIFATVILAAGGLSYRAALKVIAPVNELQEGMARFGSGNFHRHVKVPPMPVLSDLARSANAMANQLERHILSLKEERNLRVLILRSLPLGVLAVDSARHIMDMNLPARKFLAIGEDISVEGRPLTDVARLAALFTLIEQSEHSMESVVHGICHNNQILELRAAALDDLSGKRIGTLVILSDETKLRKLETIRQDFVANVSHELRTPITSIKGFAETLLEGAINDAETAERFIRIIHRQSGQLETILYDLMELAHLEQHSEQSLERTVTQLAPVLREAAGLCRERSPNTLAEIRIQCDEALVVNIHAGLVEQALVNLIDNAMKYGITPDQPTIDVVAAQEGDNGIRITVHDYGTGIDRIHLARLFERFYRVDKGRSRDIGGTGLGLAIVKHVAAVHGGTAEVQSHLGKGTTFILHLATLH